jgi:mono/diheme cytochrome c family protein
MMKAAAMKSLLAGVLAAVTVAAVAVAADVSEEKKREISAAEAADIEEEKKAKAAEEAAKKEEAGKPEISAAEAADRAEEEKAKAEAAAAGGSSAEPGTLAAAVKAAKGTLKNPFTDNKEAIAQGRQLYLDYSCNGCHGGGGGGGMCPPLTNERFVYGSDDDTIFRLIAIGSAELQKNGFKRIARETVVGPMPPYVEIIDSEEELWKIIAFVRSVYRGRAKKRDW